MYWENIEGIFTFELLYSNMVNKFHTNSVFVEIGTWKGRSAVYMAEKIKESGKNILFYTIDPFDGTGGGYDNDLDVKNKSLFKTFENNIRPVQKFITPLVGFSFDLYSKFEDESIDFLFIDGDHRYEGIKKDLQLWFPKVKKGGVISGHDYNEPSCGVRQAVDEYFVFGAKPYAGGCWVFYK